MKQLKRYVNYYDYINSQEWKQKKVWFEKQLTLRKIPIRCFVCGKHYDLQLHHRHYDTLGNETYKDMALLCSICHKRVHFVFFIIKLPIVRPLIYIRERYLAFLSNLFPRSSVIGRVLFSIFSA